MYLSMRLLLERGRLRDLLLELELLQVDLKELVGRRALLLHASVMRRAVSGKLHARELVGVLVRLARELVGLLLRGERVLVGVLLRGERVLVGVLLQRVELLARLLVRELHVVVALLGGLQVGLAVVEHVQLEVFDLVGLLDQCILHVLECLHRALDYLDGARLLGG
jgi:hypothetical protein